MDMLFPKYNNTHGYPAFHSNFTQSNIGSDYIEFEAPESHSIFNTESERLPRFSTQYICRRNSPALSTEHSLDESGEYPEDSVSTAPSWGTFSLSSDMSGMHSISSPVNTHHALANFPEPWAYPCGPSDDEAFALNSAAYSDFNFDFATDGYNAGNRYPTFVDPSVINTIPTPPQLENLMQNNYVTFAPAHPQSPALSLNSGGLQSTHLPNSRSNSPHQQWQSHSPLVSHHSSNSHNSPQTSTTDAEDNTNAKHRCPYQDCGKIFKDLKAHLLTHQDERPEKCPILSCEFHKRGFARKYDRNRHLVTTHYKSTIICGFCPGSGSSAEKSFNRTDVFKRHLVAVHGVEQTPPNGRRKSPTGSGRQSPSLPEGTTGKCSTCSHIFSCAQDLFEHLDDCVLKVVQQVDPAEANNEKLLMSVAQDEDVKTTMKNHGLTTSFGSQSFDTEDDDGACDDYGAGSRKSSIKENKTSSNQRSSGVRDGRITKPPKHNTTKFRAGLTLSQGGVVLSTGNKSQRRRHEYPRSWGCAVDNMKLKKRVLCVFDGQRRLWKDDMMLGNDQEVRVKLADGESYVTDLDVQSVHRAEALHGATDEERGPWVPTNTNMNMDMANLFDFDQLLA